MNSRTDIAGRVADAVTTYRDGGDTALLIETLDAIGSEAAPDELIEAAEPWREIPEVAGPLYERVVAQRPDDARALVILANAYWLAGRGPEQVAELASRAMAADPTHRGAWHLWALTEPELRSRVARWKQVADRFPEDQLARANLADNAASLASTAHDREALDLAIETYSQLRALAGRDEERQALDRAIETLRGWRL